MVLEEEWELQMVGQFWSAEEPKVDKDSHPVRWFLMPSADTNTSFASSDFTIRARRQDIKSHGQVVVVSKKIAKKATERNRIRRIIKEALRSVGFKDKSVAIIVKKNIANLKMDQIKNVLRDLILEYDKKSR